MQIVNWSLLKHPLNWLTVILMLFFAAIAGTLILEGLGVRPAADTDDSDKSITGAGPTTAGAILTGGDDYHATFSMNPAPGISVLDTVVTYG